MLHPRKCSIQGNVPSKEIFHPRKCSIQGNVRKSLPWEAQPRISDCAGMTHRMHRYRYYTTGHIMYISYIIMRERVYQQKNLMQNLTCTYEMQNLEVLAWHLHPTTISGNPYSHMGLFL
jgi:hypothetical protein